MDPAVLRDAILDTTAELSVVPTDRLHDPVPSCPGWDVERLLRHLARVQGWVTGVVATPADGTPPAAPQPLDDEPVGAFVARIGEQLVERLDQTEPDRLVPGFVGAVPAAFWLRRMAHEATLHRWDAREALDPGGDHLIDADLAVDGIDEVLEVLLPLRFDREGFAPSGETLHLHATDAPGEWLLTFPVDGPVHVARTHAKGDAAVRGPARDLLLAVWGRRGPEQLEVLGDASVLTRYQDAARY